MTNETREALQREWHTLQNNCQQSEALALGIKLLAVIICLLTIIYPQHSLFISMLLAVLWLQESIWKTFQGRTEQRLLSIEKAWNATDSNVDNNTDKLVDNPLNNKAALCFYSNWLASRSGAKALLGEYASNALRPTIAYPYIILLAISLTATFF